MTKLETKIQLYFELFFNLVTEGLNSLILPKTMKMNRISKGKTYPNLCNEKTLSNSIKAITIQFNC